MEFKNIQGYFTEEFKAILAVKKHKIDHMTASPTSSALIRSLRDLAAMPPHDAIFTRHDINFTLTIFMRFDAISACSDTMLMP